MYGNVTYNSDEALPLLLKQMHDKARELVKKSQSDKDKQVGELKKQLADAKETGREQW